MKSIKAIFVIALIISSNLVFGQEPSFYELTFGIDSTTTPYKANNDNFVFIRSKRGTEPVKATSAGDSIKSFVIQKIVLVFSESSTAELENRDAYNQERWENLMPTYPEFFQATTTYKNICQCSQDAAGQDYKAVQGFYIYYTPKAGSEPKKEVEVAKVETPKPAEPKKEVVKEEPKKEVESIKKVEPKKAKEVEAKVEVAKVEEVKPVEVVKKEEPKKQEPKKAKEVEAKVEEVKPVEVVKKEEPKKEVEAITPPTNTNTEEVTDSKNKATAPPAKPRKAKDPKACRTACYGTGESDLNAFFKDKVVLTKKMKKDEVDLKLQLNVDGTVKKVVIKGENAELNKLVEEAVKDMIWNASVKSGLTIKSEVKMILKFDKKLKGLKAEELMVSPRLGPKCLTCTSDEELFVK
jgi:hypothetical protein